MKPDQPAGQKFANLGDPLLGGHLVRVDRIRDLPDGKPVQARPRLIPWIAARIPASPTNFLRMCGHGWMRGTPGSHKKQVKTVA